MKSLLFQANSSLPPINEKELQRYCGIPKDRAFLFPRDLMEECVHSLRPSLCYRVFPLSIQNNQVFFGNENTWSKDLAKNLSGCTSVLLFSATLGLEFDRLLAKYSSLSPSKAVLAQAFGAERIEAFCDLFCKKLKEEHAFVAPRFSPGYGDLPLTLQNKILLLLEAPNTIGVHVTDSSLLCPTKSVTAFVGIRETNEEL